MLLASVNMLRSAIMLGSTVKLGFMVPLKSPREPQLARQPEPDWVRLSALPSRCCKRRFQLPGVVLQYVHTCFTRFLTGMLKATWAPLSMGQTQQRGCYRTRRCEH